jgi:hypothetical protein
MPSSAQDNLGSEVCGRGGDAERNVAGVVGGPNGPEETSCLGSGVAGGPGGSVQVCVEVSRAECGTPPIMRYVLREK